MNVHVAIKSCLKYSDRRAACEDTWLQHIDWEWNFIIGRDANGGLPTVPNAIVCDVDDGFGRMAPKVWCACVYALENNAHRLLIVDDDTYVSTRIRDVSPRGDYVGFVRTQGFGALEHVPYIQGSAYWLSAKAMEFIVEAKGIMVPGIIDDGAVGRALDGKVALTHDRRYWPGPEASPILMNNNLITTHKCLPANMRFIHRNAQL